MASLTVLNAGGDTQVTWDDRALADGDADALNAVAEAERLFAAARAAGAEAFVVRQGSLARRVTTLERDQDMVIIPRMVGGCL
jgi:hypothetical protein